MTLGPREVADGDDHGRLQRRHHLRKGVTASLVDDFSLCGRQPAVHSFISFGVLTSRSVEWGRRHRRQVKWEKTSVCKGVFRASSLEPSDIPHRRSIARKYAETTVVFI